MRSTTINIEFSTDMRRICHWGQRMGVDLCDSKKITEPYAWAQCHILSLVDQLVDFHGFRQADVSDNRMLFALVCDPHAWRVGRVPPVIPPRKRIELPVHASSFFSPDRRKQWENIFHSPLWHSIWETSVPGANAVIDLLNLLQCLLPGMLIIAEVQDGWSNQRGIPPLKWVRESREVLISCLGTERYEVLCQAASDNSRAIIDSRDSVDKRNGLTSQETTKLHSSIY
jgi:hypothetical protein